METGRFVLSCAAMLQQTFIHLPGIGPTTEARLWREWQAGSARSLEVLLAYNREDIANLAPLMRLAYDRLRRSLPLAE